MIEVIIGAQFGDEGKGLLTDYLCRANTLNVRFNGGGQAGHTVVRPTGERHVFRQVGAGYFQGAATLLSRFFLLNPLTFNQELHTLVKRQHPRVYVDQRVRIITPFDVWLNQNLERSRGDKRHGSCGMGINETVTRNEHYGFELDISILRDHVRRRPRLEAIQKFYMRSRAHKLGVEIPEHAYDPRLIDLFLEGCDVMLEHINIASDVYTLKKYPDSIVFEGAQGLRLDEFSKEFPHVTRSRTGLTNIRTLIHEAYIHEPVNVNYVTRAYTTRHGNGPLKNESFGHPYDWVGPETNVSDEFQGEFRYAPLDVIELKDAIYRDWSGMLLKIQPSLTITCVDQVRDFEPMHVAQQIALPLRFISMGPTRSSMIAVDPLEIPA